LFGLPDTSDETNLAKEHRTPVLHVLFVVYVFVCVFFFVGLLCFFFGGRGLLVQNKNMFLMNLANAKIGM
jgi:hypothetical protein